MKSQNFLIYTSIIPLLSEYYKNIIYSTVTLFARFLGLSIGLSLFLAT